MTPKHITSALLAAFRNYTSDQDYGFPIWDNAANVWLCNKFGLHTDSPRFILDGMELFFNWSIQVWTVK